METRLYPEFMVTPSAERPWVNIWTPDGFREGACLPYLTFWAWQDVAPRRLRHEARVIAASWTWLRSQNVRWDRATLEDWANYAQWLFEDRQKPQATLTQIHQRFEILYRFYGFWHWYDPHRIRYQFWPNTRRDRQQWLRALWEQNPFL